MSTVNVLGLKAIRNVAPRQQCPARPRSQCSTRQNQNHRVALVDNQQRASASTMTTLLMI